MLLFVDRALAARQCKRMDRRLIVLYSAAAGHDGVAVVLPFCRQGKCDTDKRSRPRISVERIDKRKVVSFETVIFSS